MSRWDRPVDGVDVHTPKTRLQGLGFSGKEDEVYVSVVHHRTATVKQLANGTDTSAWHVYGITEALAERGVLTLDDQVTDRDTGMRASQLADGSHPLKHTKTLKCA